MEKDISKKIQIGVIGANFCSSEVAMLAERVGQEIARRGGVLVCGGLDGVMKYAAKGAKQEKGLTVGILPGFSPDEANKFIDIPIVTGLSHARNIIVVRSSNAIVALPGEYGTLSEIAFALKLGIPVVGLNTWEIRGVIPALTPEDAVERAFEEAMRQIR